MTARVPYGGMPPFQQHSDTSKEAALLMVGAQQTVKAKVMEVIVRGYRELTGATRDEIEQATGLKMQTVNPRVAELKAEGRVRETAEKRLTRSGRWAHVFVAIAPDNGYQQPLIDVPIPKRWQG